MASKEVFDIAEKIDLLLRKWQSRYAGKTLTELDKEDVHTDLVKHVNEDLRREGYSSIAITEAWIVWSNRKGRDDSD